MAGWWPVACLAAALAATTVRTVDAAPPAGIEWLMKEPATLFDIGLLNLRRDLGEVAKWLVDERLVAATPAFGVYWDWREEAIIAYLTFDDIRGDGSEASCRQMFGRVVRRMTRGMPDGTRRGQIYLEGLFLHGGPGNLGRPARLGEDLSERVRLEISWLPPWPAQTTGRRVRCAGGLDADPAAIAVRIVG